MSEKISKYCPNFTALFSFFDAKKLRPKTNLESRKVLLDNNKSKIL